MILIIIQHLCLRFKLANVPDILEMVADAMVLWNKLYIHVQGV